MSILVDGVLKSAAGNVIGNADMVFTSISTSLVVMGGTPLTVQTDAEGRYSFTLHNGNYAVSISKGGNNWFSGMITVTDVTVPKSVNALLLQDAMMAEIPVDYWSYFEVQTGILFTSFGKIDEAVETTVNAKDVAVDASAKTELAARRAEVSATEASIYQQSAALSANVYQTSSAVQKDINDGVIPLNNKLSVRSADPLVWIAEYKNQDGVATPTGKTLKSGEFFNSIPRSNLAPTFMFNGPIPGDTIAHALDDGDWYGAKASDFIDAPDGWMTNPIVVRVSEETGLGNFKRQEIHNFSRPSQILARRVDVIRGTATGWMAPDRSDMFTFAGTVATGALLTSSKIDGIHYANPGVYPDAPNGFPINRAFTVNVWEVTGSKRFKHQELRNFTTIYDTYIRTVDYQNGTATNWVSSRTQFKRVVNSGSYNDIIEDGNYITIFGLVTDGPPVTGSYFVRVGTSLDSNFNVEYCKQELTLLSNPIIKYERFIRPNKPEFAEWVPISGGGGGGSGDGQFKDKKIAFFGDSLVEFGTQSELISARLGAAGLKMGFGGCRMGKHSDSGYDGMSMYNIAKAIAAGDFTALLAAAEQVKAQHRDDKLTQANLVATTNWGTVDYAVIAFGTNDFGGSYTWNNVIGTIDDFTPDGSTFMGSVNYVINRLLTRNPKMRLIFISPIWRHRTPTDRDGIVGGSDVSPNLNGDYVIDFVDALIACCKKHHIEVWDGYRTSGISQLTADVFISDGVHPTADGYNLLADKEAAFLSSKF